MQYNKVMWVDRKTIVNAERLNNMEDGIYNAHLEVHDAQSQIGEIQRREIETNNQLNEIKNEKGYITTKILSDGTDFNSLVSNGKYRIYRGLNSPKDGDFMFVIEVTSSSSSNVSQIASLVNSERALYQRACINGVWSAWERIVTHTEAEAIKTNIKQIESEADALEQRVATNEGDISSIKTNIVSIEQEIDSIQGVIGTEDGASGTILDRISTNEEDISSLKGRVSNTETNIEGLKQEDITIKGRVSTNETNISSLQDRASVSELDIQKLKEEDIAIKGRVSTNESDIDSLEVRVSTNELDITSLKQEDITIKGRVSTNELDIVDLKSKTSTNELDIASLKQEDIEIKNRVSANENNIDSLGARVTVNETDIQSLKQEDIAIKGRVLTNETEISSLKDRNLANEGEISSLGQRVSTNETNIQTLQQEDLSNKNRLTINEASIAQLKEEDTLIKSRVDSLEGKVTSSTDDLKASLQANIDKVAETAQTNLSTVQTELQGSINTVNTKAEENKTKIASVDTDLQSHKTDLQAHSDIRQQIGDVNSLMTNSKEVVGAINELYLNGGSSGGAREAKVLGSERVLRLTATTTTNTFDAGVFLNPDKVQVYLMGLRLFDGKDFTVNESSIILSSTLLEGEYIDIVFVDELLIDVTSNTMVETHHRYTASTTTSSFVAEGALKYGFLDVFQMGVKLYKDFDYTVDIATNTITLVQPLEEGDYVDYSIRNNLGTDITSIKDSLDYIMTKKEDIEQISALKENVNTLVSDTSVIKGETSSLQQETLSLKSSLLEANLKIGSSVKEVEASNNFNCVRIIKNDGTATDVPIKILGGSSGASLNVFKTSEQGGSFTATQETNSFIISEIEENMDISLIFKNLLLVKDVDFTINKESKTVALNFMLKADETIYYILTNTSFKYEDLDGAPNVGDTNGLSTTSKEVVGAINENMGNIAVLNNDRGYLTSKMLTNIDLNTVVDNGIYSCLGCTNRPNMSEIDTNVGMMTVVLFNHGNRVKQVYYNEWGSSFERNMLTDKSWTAWQQIATIRDLNNKTYLTSGGGSSEYYVPTKPSDYQPDALTVRKLRTCSDIGGGQYGFWATLLGIRSHGASNCFEMGFTNDGNMIYRKQNENNDSWLDWQQIATTTVSSIDIPFNLGYVGMGYTYVNRIDKINNQVTIHIGVKKSDGSNFPANTSIPLFTLPTGYLKYGGSVTNACIGEVAAGGNHIYGSLFIEGNVVYVKMSTECIHIRGQIQYLSQ